MKLCLILLQILTAAGSALPLLGQHHGKAGAAEAEAQTFVVTGLRVDADSPPPGSGVGRAGARLPGGGYLHVVHGKPYARGRVVFGGVVAFDQIWSTGAHVSSEFAVTVPVTVGGKDLEPGLYSLFTTPGRERWTLHLNRVLGMHLADEYDASQDVLVAAAVPTEPAEPSPDLRIEFVPAGAGVDLVIRWSAVQVSFPVRSR
ncbi:MAG: DUF2911 domain-containing protein [Acidobacteriota bacterium]